VSYFSVNGLDGIRGHIVMPLTGVWVADVACEPTSALGSFPNPGTAATLNFGTLSLNGTVRRASNPYGTTFARLVAGAGNLPQVLPPLSYQSTTFNQVMSDILSACGENLASNCDPTITGISLPFWVRAEMPAWQAIANLFAVCAPTGNWRVLPNGYFWVGVDKYPQTTMQTFELLSYLPNELRAEMYSDTPTLLPGETFIGGQVSSIEHNIEPDKVWSSVLFIDQQLDDVEAGDG
jgi:hypothetical protein